MTLSDIPSWFTARSRKRPIMPTTSAAQDEHELRPGPEQFGKPSSGPKINPQVDTLAEMVLDLEHAQDNLLDQIRYVEELQAYIETKKAAIAQRMADRDQELAREYQKHCQLRARIGVTNVKPEKDEDPGDNSGSGSDTPPVAEPSPNGSAGPVQAHSPRRRNLPHVNGGAGKGSPRPPQVPHRSTH